MAGESNLEKLLSAMKPVLLPGVYVFATVPSELETKDLAPRMVFEEAEGKTLILLQETAKKHELKHEFPSRMITLNIHSSLDAVGFIAAITTELAALKMGVNPVSAFYHDHLFVPADRADQALAALLEFTN